jgi:lysophospholipase L1-like esterase
VLDIVKRILLALVTVIFLAACGSGGSGSAQDSNAFVFLTVDFFSLNGTSPIASLNSSLSDRGTSTVVCFGDSITDGTGSTLNGDDRWPDVFARRLHAAYGPRFTVVNAGIGGNRITSPAPYDPKTPFAGGPSALDRLERDVLSLSGVSTIIWLEGINDLSSGTSAEAVIAGMKDGVQRIRARGAIRVIGATITPALGAASAAGTPDVDARRKTVNAFVRSSGIFDGVADFDAVTRDATTGGLRAEFQPNSSIGGPGDALHPNRAGYLAMGNAVDLKMVVPAARR